MGNNMEAIYDKKIAKHMFPVEYLPDDYNGPNNGHIKDLISKYPCLEHLPHIPWSWCKQICVGVDVGHIYCEVGASMCTGGVGVGHKKN